MPTHHTHAGAGTSAPNPTPPALAGWLSPFRGCFSAPVWSRVLVLVAGAVLAPGKRTVSQALRVMGLAAAPGFSRYHEVLNRARWNGRAVRHKTAVDWARQAVLQAKRWLPGRRLVVVADASFSGVGLIAALRRHVCLVTRLRIDASLFAPAPPRRPGQMGRPRLKGRRLPGLKAALADLDTVWSRVTVAEWYGGQPRELEVASDIAIWYNSGLPPAPIRWVLVRDPCGEREPQAFLSTDLAAEPERVLGRFVSRWRMETTFQEVRAHLGVETQRQWSDLAVSRTTPALLGLFSLVAVWAGELARAPIGAIRPRTAAWYDEREPTFSDAIAAVRRALWRSPGLAMSRPSTDTVEISASLLQRLTDTLCHAA